MLDPGERTGTGTISETGSVLRIWDMIKHWIRDKNQIREKNTEPRVLIIWTWQGTELGNVSEKMCIQCSVIPSSVPERRFSSTTALTHVQNRWPTGQPAGRMGGFHCSIRRLCHFLHSHVTFLNISRQCKAKYNPKQRIREKGSVGLSFLSSCFAPQVN